MRWIILYTVKQLLRMYCSIAQLVHMALTIMYIKILLETLFPISCESTYFGLVKYMSSLNFSRILCLVPFRHELRAGWVSPSASQHMQMVWIITTPYAWGILLIDAYIIRQPLSYFLSAYLYFCLSVFLSFCLSVYLSFCLSVFLPICISVYLSFCLSVFLPICISVFLSVFLSICLSVSVFLSICLSVYLYFCLSVFLSICLSVFLSICRSSCLSVYLSFYLSFCLSVFLVSLSPCVCVSLSFTQSKTRSTTQSKTRLTNISLWFLPMKSKQQHRRKLINSYSEGPIKWRTGSVTCPIIISKRVARHIQMCVLSLSGWPPPLLSLWGCVNVNLKKGWHHLNYQAGTIFN
jgi:hypothetical protein